MNRYSHSFEHNQPKRLKSNEEKGKSLNGTNDDKKRPEATFNQVTQLQIQKHQLMTELDPNQLVCTNHLLEVEINSKKKLFLGFFRHIYRKKKKLPLLI